MGKTSSTPQTTSQTSTKQMPDFAQGLIGGANSVLGGNSPLYKMGNTGSTSQTGISGLSDSPLTQAANQQAINTMGGNYLYSDPSMGYMNQFAQGTNPALMQYGAVANQNPYQSTWYNAMAPTTSVMNPFLGQAFDQAASRIGQQYSNQVLPGVASQFSLAGRTGSGAQQEALSNATQNYGDTLSRLGTSMYLPAYENAIARQAQLAQMLQSNDSQRLGALGNVAQMQFAGAQGLSSPYQAERSRQLQSAGLAPALGERYTSGGSTQTGLIPSDELARLQAASGVLTPLALGFAPTTTTSTQDLYRNQSAGLLGGAASGAGIGNMIAPGGPGAAIGAGLGGLLASL